MNKKLIILFFSITIVLLSINSFRIYHSIDIFSKNQYENYANELTSITLDIKKTADTIYSNSINNEKVIEIFKKAHISNEKEKSIIRNTLYNTLKNSYKIFTIAGIQQLHFHLPNNESFLRFHKPKKFGDDLTKIRDSVNYVNKHKKPTIGFEEGRIFNGYRFVYPLFDEKKTHIGSAEVSISLLSFKETFQKTKNLQLDYILSKEIVLSKVFDSELQNYVEYSFLKDFLIQTTLKKSNENNFKNLFNIDVFLKDTDISNNLTPIKEQIHHKFIDNKLIVMYFIPLLNDFNKKKVGYKVIVEESHYSEYYSSSVIISYIVFFIMAVLISYILKEKIKFEDETYTDPLTKLYNRKYYLKQFTKQIKKLQNEDTPFSIILCDIDSFKAINDTFGHNIGDEVLKDIGKLFNSMFRRDDIRCRVGGEEFLIIFPQLTLAKAVELAESLRENVEKNLNTIEDKTITISLGVTEAKKTDTADSLFKRIDEFLYISKNDGRNRVTSDSEN